MPIVNGQYQNPGWVDGQEPAIDAEELNAISNSIVSNQNKYTKNESMSTEVASIYPGPPSCPSDIFYILKDSILFKNTSNPLYTKYTLDLSTKSEGDIVQILEGNVLKNYIVGKINYQQDLNPDGRTLLIRQDTIDTRWGSLNSYGYYSGPYCTIYQSINGYFSSKLPQQLKTAAATTNYYVNKQTTPTTVNSIGLTISCYEVGVMQNNASTMSINIGETFSQNVIDLLLNPFANTSNYGGIWTRDHNSNPLGSNFGALDLYWNSYWMRNTMNSDLQEKTYYCFTLPNNYSTTFYYDEEGNTYNEQAYSESYYVFGDINGNQKYISTSGTGSYVGNGNYGSSSPNSITFQFKPSLVIVQAPTSSPFTIFFTINSYTNSFSIYTPGQIETSTSMYVKYDNTSNTLSWYTTQNSSRYQFNVSGAIYQYIAIP